MKRFTIAVVLMSFLACSRHSAPQEPKLSGKVYVGLASYYGHEFHGKETASGAIFDENRLTAAHPFLPFGTRVLVTNLENERSVIVTITDRGPLKEDRIIDLSYGAARELDMLTAGVVKVRVEIFNEQ